MKRRQRQTMARAGARARPESGRARVRSATARASPNHRRRRHSKRWPTRRMAERTVAEEARAKAKAKARFLTAAKWRMRSTRKRWFYRRGDLMEELGTKQRPLRSSRAEEATATATVVKCEQGERRVSASGKDTDVQASQDTGGKVCSRTFASKEPQLHTSSRPRSCNNLLTMGRFTANNDKRENEHEERGRAGCMRVAERALQTITQAQCQATKQSMILQDARARVCPMHAHTYRRWR
jgi:hypothetical protein